MHPQPHPQLHLFLQQSQWNNLSQNVLIQHFGLQQQDCWQQGAAHPVTQGAGQHEETGAGQQGVAQGAGQHGAAQGAGQHGVAQGAAHPQPQLAND